MSQVNDSDQQTCTLKKVLKKTKRSSPDYKGFVVVKGVPFFVYAWSRKNPASMSPQLRLSLSEKAGDMKGRGEVNIGSTGEVFGGATLNDQRTSFDLSGVYTPDRVIIEFTQAKGDYIRVFVDLDNKTHEKMEEFARENNSEVGPILRRLAMNFVSGLEQPD